MDSGPRRVDEDSWRYVSVRCGCGSEVMTVADVSASASERPMWRAVAVPSEHGGWGLTLEPVLLGLLIAPSMVGAMLGVGAFVAFLLRTPLKLIVIEIRRKRWLSRSQLATKFVIGELLVLALIASVALRAAGWSWLLPVVIAAPLVGVEFWFDVHSRGRRLVPELCGSVGIASVVSVIVLASGNSFGLAIGAWMVLSARAVGAIPFIRVQIARLRGTSESTQLSDAAQAVAVAMGVAAVVIDRQMLAGFIGLLALALLQLVWVRKAPLPAKTLGLRQMVLGVGIVAVTAAGVLL
ncbi:MAG: hypothetical protein D4R95_02715 [Actinobacteria bacterium]|nr:MAG: hypothetical protein D4R95_02715 [Actinomycetota bacterium]